MERQIGFIGLGAMGRPMVENLASAGDLQILAYDTTPAALDELARLPSWNRTLRPAKSMNDFAACDIVITMLPNSAITNLVIAGDASHTGLAQVLAHQAIVVDMGSSNPADTGRLAQTLEARSIGFVDAPVSGAIVKARTGKLAIMIGGDNATVARVQPMLSRLGETFIRTGPVGSAHAMKALNNYVYAAGLLAACEATLIAERAGLDTAVFSDVLNASSGRNVATETKLRQFIVPRTFNGGFALRLQAKDLTTAEALRAQTGTTAPQLALCEALWRQANEYFGPGADNTSIYRFVEHHPKIE